MIEAEGTAGRILNARERAAKLERLRAVLFVVELLQISRRESERRRDLFERREGERLRRKIRELLKVEAIEAEAVEAIEAEAVATRQRLEEEREEALRVEKFLKEREGVGAVEGVEDPAEARKRLKWARWALNAWKRGNVGAAAVGGVEPSRKINLRGTAGTALNRRRF